MNSLLNKLYHFDSGVKSENIENMETIEEVDSIIDKDVTRIFDRGMDRPICTDFIIAGEGNFSNFNFQGSQIFVPDFFETNPN